MDNLYDPVESTPVKDVIKAPKATVTVEDVPQIAHKERVQNILDDLDKTQAKIDGFRGEIRTALLRSRLRTASHAIGQSKISLTNLMKNLK